MAFDLLSGETNTSSWARGDVVLDAAASRAKKLPWGKIGLAAGIAVGGLWLLSSDEKHAGRVRRRADDDAAWLNETREIPRESMKQLVYGRKR